MTAFLRNTLLAAAAVSALAGSALADQTTTICGKNTTNNPWSGRCCGTGDGTCLGGGGNGNHGNNGGGSPGGRGNGQR